VTAVGQLTFSKLKEMECSQSNPDDEVKGAMEFKQFNLLPMPEKAIIQMESRNTKSLVLFVVHPLDGTVSLLQSLMKEADMTVYGLQCNKEAPLESVEALAKFYIQQIKTVQENGPYYLGGYSYGATIAFEMTIQLEREGEVVEHLVLLDGCHMWPRFIAHTIIHREIEENDVTWLLYFLHLHMPLNLDKTETEMSALLTLEEKLEKAVQMLQAIYAEYSPAEIRDLAQAFSKRLNVGYRYKPSQNVRSKTTLIRAGAAGFDKKIGNDYQLNQVCETLPTVLVIDAHHYCFHQRPLELGIPKLLNSIFDSNVHQLLQ
jgi:fatty acid synthase